MGSLLALDRGRVRRRFEARFSATRMAHDYIRVYESQLRAGGNTHRLEGLNSKVARPAESSPALV
jgi:hypothetical protein